MRKTISFDCMSNEITNKILSLSNSDEIEIYEGSLRDNYIVCNSNNITLGRVKPRKYIIIKEQYLNEWSSHYKILLTDSGNVVDKYRKIFEN